ncbi:MAG TPA: ATP-dependent DNA helicase RecG [Spirochaetota bacterium]|nr:ATP-dependent DNA helicase RecG [Spirochaetota bacterium]
MSERAANLHGSTAQLRGIGERKAALLKQEAGIETVEDLLYYTPRRYIDRSSFKLVRDCFVNETVTVSGVVVESEITGFKKKRLEVVIDDGSEPLTGVFFAGIDYFRKRFTPGDRVIFSGKINFFKNKQIVHPEFDFIDENPGGRALNTGRIVPLYPSSEKLSGIGFDSRGFRRSIGEAIELFLPMVEDSLERDILVRHGLIGLREALSALHFPESYEQAEIARKRLAFNEIFFLQYYLLLCKKYRNNAAALPRHSYDYAHIRKFIHSLPFQLTPDQKTAFDDIMRDISQPFPMNRLIQGDVGSGKTVVAMGAALLAARAGRQCAVMAPTEVLARQHYRNFSSMLPDDSGLEIITGGTPVAEKTGILQGLESGSIRIIIGTHALIQERVAFRDLGLIIIDEQHRFGVNQRAALREKGKDADLLVMTATPIPRSLSLTMYGDLDVTSIKTKPLTRIPVKTLAFPESRLDGVYRSMEKYINEGRQIFYVLPLIEESEKIDLKSAVETFERLSSNVFSHRRLALLHGKMRQDEKDEIMSRFKAGDIDILVSTTVIEVGIDIQNANVIVIEHAERFGLSQLHQLRGRVGRGAHQSFCVLIHPDEISDESMGRIMTIVNTDDGFAIAEEDLKMRGAGEIIGSRQHGRAGNFEFTSLAEDLDLIKKARREAGLVVDLIKNIDEAFIGVRENRYSGMLQGIRKKRVLSILS